jgi:hypothetical protein
MALVRIPLEHLLDDRAQPVDAVSHVDEAGRKVDAHTCDAAGYTGAVERVLLVCLLAAGGCGKQLNAEFCATHPTDDRCVASVNDSGMDSATLDARLVTCPTKYDITIPSQPFSKYLREDNIDDWDSAVGKCADDAPGSTHLAVLNRATELAELASYFDRPRFIGLTDKVTDGTYLAVTDEPIDYPALYVPATPPWKSGEPDSSGDCVSIDNNLEAEEDCTGATVDLAWLCECDGIADDPNNY